jgi:hypothetical protein
LEGRVKFHFWSLVCGLCNRLNRGRTSWHWNKSLEAWQLNWQARLYLWSVRKMSDADDWGEP